MDYPSIDDSVNEGLVAAAPESAPAEAPAPVAPADRGFFSPEIDHMRSVFRDPRALHEIAMAAYRFNQPEAMKWMEKGFLAEKENAIEATQALIAGDKKRAIERFNSTGRQKVVSLDEVAGKPGSYSAKMSDGTVRVFDPREEMLSYLPPESAEKIRLERAKAAKDAKVSDAVLQHYKDVGEHYVRADANAAKATEETVALRKAQLAATAAARAQAAQDKKDREAERKDAKDALDETRRMNVELNADKSVKDYLASMYETDPVTGKKKAAAGLAFLPDIKAAARDASGGDTAKYLSEITRQTQKVLGEADTISNDLMAAEAQQKDAGIFSGADKKTAFTNKVKEYLDAGKTPEQLRQIWKYGGREVKDLNAALEAARKPPEPAKGMGIGAPVTEAAPTPSVTGEDGGAPVKTPGATRRLRVDPATGRLVPV